MYRNWLVALSICFSVSPVYATASVMDALMEDIGTRQFEKAAEILESHPDLDLLQKWGRYGTSTLWMTLNPEDYREEFTDPAALSFNSDLQRFTPEQRAFANNLIRREPRLLTAEHGKPALPPLAYLFQYYDMMYQSHGAEAARHYLEKIKYVLSLGARLSQQATIPNNFRAPIPMFLAMSARFHALKTISELGLFDLNEPVEVIDFTSGPEGQSMIDSVAAQAARQTLLPAATPEDRLPAFFDFLRAQMRAGLSLTETIGRQQSIITTTFDRAIGAGRRGQPSFNPEIRARALTLLDFYHQNGWDVNGRIELAGLGADRPIRWAARAADPGIAFWLLQHGARRTDVEPNLLEALTSQAFVTRQADFLNALFPTREAQLVRLNRRFTTSQFRYLPGPLNVAVHSLNMDGDLQATIDWIHALIERGADPSLRSEANYTVDMEPSWARQRFNLERAVPPEQFAALEVKYDELEAYLKSPAFREFVRQNLGRRAGEPFPEVGCEGRLK